MSYNNSGLLAFHNYLRPSASLFSCASSSPATLSKHTFNLTSPSPSSSPSLKSMGWSFSTLTLPERRGRVLWERVVQVKYLVTSAGVEREGGIQIGTGCVGRNSPVVKAPVPRGEVAVVHLTVHRRQFTVPHRDRAIKG